MILNHVFPSWTLPPESIDGIPPGTSNSQTYWRPGARLGELGELGELEAESPAAASPGPSDMMSEIAEHDYMNYN